MAEQKERSPRRGPFSPRPKGSFGFLFSQQEIHDENPFPVLWPPRAARRARSGWGEELQANPAPSLAGRVEGIRPLPPAANGCEGYGE